MKLAALGFRRIGCLVTRFCSPGGRAIAGLAPVGVPSGAPRSWLQGRAGTPLVRGALEALLVPLAFVALGLAWWGGVERAPLARSVYPGVLMESIPALPAPPPAEVTPAEALDLPGTSEAWLVDGYNVVQVGLLRDRSRERWWTAERREELLAQTARFARAGAPLWVVFDGARESVQWDDSGQIRTIFAASADAWLVARLKEAHDPARVVVVTADRRLANRVRHHGGRVVGPGEFLRECDAPEPEPEVVRST